MWFLSCVDVCILFLSSYVCRNESSHSSATKTSWDQTRPTKRVEERKKESPKIKKNERKKWIKWKGRKRKRKRRRDRGKGTENAYNLSERVIDRVHADACSIVCAWIHSISIQIQTQTAGWWFYFALPFGLFHPTKQSSLGRPMVQTCCSWIQCATHYLRNQDWNSVWFDK